MGQRGEKAKYFLTSDHVNIMVYRYLQEAGQDGS
jgi:hypothetical protein